MRKQKDGMEDDKGRRRGGGEKRIWVGDGVWIRSIYFGLARLGRERWRGDC